MAWLAVVGVPLVMALAIPEIMSWIYSAREARRAGRARRGLCPICGYDLEGTPTDAERCAECGVAVRGGDRIEVEAGLASHMLRIIVGIACLSHASISCFVVLRHFRLGLGWTPNERALLVAACVGAVSAGVSWLTIRRHRNLWDMGFTDRVWWEIFLIYGALTSSTAGVVVVLLCRATYL